MSERSAKQNMKYVIELEVGNFEGTIIEAENIEEAESRARQWVRDLALGDAASHVGCTIIDEEGDELRIDIVVGGPGVPDCKRWKMHEWRSPHAVVGGWVENPGVWELGEGRLKITEVCANCGTYRHRTTQSLPGCCPPVPEPPTYSEPDGNSLAWVLQRSEDRGHRKLWRMVDS